MWLVNALGSSQSAPGRNVDSSSSLPRDAVSQRCLLTGALQAGGPKSESAGLPPTWETPSGHLASSGCPSLSAVSRFTAAKF